MGNTDFPQLSFDIWWFVFENVFVALQKIFIAYGFDVYKMLPISFPIRCMKYQDIKISHRPLSSLGHMGKQKMGNVSKVFSSLQINLFLEHWLPSCLC